MKNCIEKNWYNKVVGRVARKSLVCYCLCLPACSSPMLPKKFLVAVHVVVLGILFIDTKAEYFAD